MIPAEWDVIVSPPLVDCRDGAHAGRTACVMHDANNLSLAAIDESVRRAEHAHIVDVGGHVRVDEQLDLAFDRSGEEQRE